MKGLNDIKTTTPVAVLVDHDIKEVQEIVNKTNFKPVSGPYDFLEVEEIETGFTLDIILTEYTTLYLNCYFYYELAFNLIKAKQEVTQKELDQILDQFNFK